MEIRGTTGHEQCTKLFSPWVPTDWRWLKQWAVLSWPISSTCTKHSNTYCGSKEKLSKHEKKDSVSKFKSMTLRGSFKQAKGQVTVASNFLMILRNPSVI